MLKRNGKYSGLTICFLLFAIAVVPVKANQRRRGESASSREIRRVLDLQVAAWNRGDLEGFMKGYWHSPELTFFSGGTKTSGWKTTLDRYRNRYQSAGAEMGQLDFSELKIELLGPQSAFVRGHWHLKMADSEPQGLFTLIFRKYPDGWKIIHDHTGSS